MVARPLRLHDLSLKGKVTATLTAVFAGVLGVFLLVLVPLQREQRQRLLERDKRLVETLRGNYERRFIYDALSRNAESLAVNLADLARQPDIVWVRVSTRAGTLAATADPLVMARALDDLPAGWPEGAVLLLPEGELARVVDAAGRPLDADLPVHVAQAPNGDGLLPGEFDERDWNGEHLLHLLAELKAAGQDFGHLHVVYSLAHLGHGESLTRTLFYGLAGTSFFLLLVLLNLLIARIVLAPVQRVMDAMQRASTGDLRVRLDVPSSDELGRMAGSFNRMVEELEVSKHEIEDHSRNLEAHVTERTRELRASEARLLRVRNDLATVIANVGTGVIALDAEGRITNFNERAAQILAVELVETEGHTLEEAASGTEGRLLADFIADVTGGQMVVKKGQVSVQRADGRRTLSLVASALHGDRHQRVGTVVVIDDLTQILASQRLEAWKEAVERVIHEIKNPLTPVGLAAQTLRTTHEKDRRHFEQIFPSAMEMILRSVRDLKTLITEFTRFSRLPEVHVSPQDLNALVAEVLEPYEHGVPEGVAVVRRLEADLPPVEADAVQLKRVLLNVINNGLEAMADEGGRLHVATLGLDASGRVAVRVQDEGPGVEDVERIFEPHYTTKVKGTGLGLAIARQIVEEHGGHIHVESALEKGTTVEIRLPATASE